MGVTLFLMLSSVAHGDVDEQQSHQSIDVIKQRLIAAETQLPSDIRATNKLLTDLTESPELLHQSLALDVVLLQVYRNITLGKLDKAKNQLNAIEKQKSSIDSFSRQLYFRAVIALKALDFERVFILLNRMNQLDMTSLRLNHQFDIYLLAANIYAKANVFDDAIGYANKALTIASKSKNTLLECRALNSLAYISHSDSKFLQLEKLAQRVISLCGDNQYIGELATAYFYMGMWHGHQLEYAHEQQFLILSITHYSKLQTPLQRAKIQLHLANSLMNSDKILDADRELSQALEIITPSTDVEAKTFGFNIKAKLLEKMGLLDDAMFYFKHYLNAHKASSSQTKSINIAYLQRRFESKVNRQARELDKAESELVNLKLQQSSLKNWVMLLSALLIGSISLFLVVFYKRKQTLSLIEQQQKDELTQCFNMDYGVIKANELIAGAIKSKCSVALITCNIDNMESINLNFNYDFGDIFLHSFAVKLSCLRTRNVVTIRKSGDEFMLVAVALSFNQMLELVQDAHNALNGIIIDNQPLNASLSTGSAFVDHQADDKEAMQLEPLIARAMIALVHAKSNGGNCGYCAQGGEFSAVRCGPRQSQLHPGDGLLDSN